MVLTALVTNISVKEVGQDWTFINSNISIDNNGLEIISQGGNRPQANQIISGLTVGNKYKLSAIAKRGTCVLSVEIEISGIGSTVATNKNNTTEFANIFYEFIANSTSHTIQAKIDDGASATGETAFFKSVSLIEITDDTNLPRINYEGFSYQDSLGSELVTNGNFATDTDWSMLPSWSIANGKASYNGVGNGHYIKQNASLIIGKEYIAKFDVLDNSGKFRISVDSGTASYNNYTTGNGAYSFTFVASSSEFFIRASMGFLSDTFSIDNVSVKEYLGQEVVPDSGCGSWLLEPQSTNLVTQSELFSDSYWAKSSSSVVSGFTSPSGVLSAFKLVEDTATTTHQIQRFFSFLNQKYSLSAFLKADERNWIKVNLYDGSSSVYAYFDLTNGVVGQELGATGKIENYGNGWYRCSITTTLNVSAGNGNISLRLAENNGGTGYVGDGTSGAYIYGAMLEQQSYSTSYIPTNGAASTRLQDIANNSGNSTLINSTEGVLYAEIAALADDLTNRGISISDGASTNRITFLLSSLSSTLRVFGLAGGVQFNLQNSSFNTLNYNKIAVLYQLNNFKFFINGTQIGSSTSGAVPVGLNSIAFDNGSGGAKFFGKVKAVVVYKEALTDEQLTCLTTI